MSSPFNNVFVKIMIIIFPRLCLIEYASEKNLVPFSVVISNAVLLTISLLIYLMTHASLGEHVKDLPERMKEAPTTTLTPT